MGRCGIVRAVQIAIVIVSIIVSGGSARAEVVLGASFGYTHFTYPDIPDFTNNIVGIPGTQDWSQPGIRVGYVAPGRRWDLNADVGLMHRSGTIGSPETTVELFPQVQVNAAGRRGFSPFVNGGVGMLYETAFTSPINPITATRPVFGAGVGVRKSVSDEHGRLRFELRYDRVSKSEKTRGPGDTFTFPATNLFSVKLGFDLLVAR